MNRSAKRLVMVKTKLHGLFAKSIKLSYIRYMKDDSNTDKYQFKPLHIIETEA